MGDVIMGLSLRTFGLGHWTLGANAKSDFLN